MTQQLSFLSRQLSDLAGRPTADVAPVTLEDALSSLEAAVEPLRKLRVQHKITERRCHEAEDQLHNLRTEFNRNRDCEQDPRLITPGPPPPGHGPEDETDCWICHARLGKRFLNPRHHCRACGRLVCGQCSPSRILMDGRTTLQRACAQCTRSVQEVPNATRRLQVLAAGLSVLLGARSNPATSAAGLCSRLATLGTLEGAIRECEVGLALLKEAET